MIQIDTEGYDFEILKLINFHNYHPDLLVYEHVHLGEIERAAAKQLLESASYETAQLATDTIAASTTALESLFRLRRTWALVRRREWVNTTTS